MMRIKNHFPFHIFLKKIVFLIQQIAIEFVTYWDQGFGKFNWIVWKNVIVAIFGVFALVFGSKSAIEEIIAMYTTSPIVPVVLNATTSSN